MTTRVLRHMTIKLGIQLQHPVPSKCVFSWHFYEYSETSVIERSCSRLCASPLLSLYRRPRAAPMSSIVKRQPTHQPATAAAPTRHAG